MASNENLSKKPLHKRLSAVYRDARHENKDSSLKGKATLAAALGGTAFEWTTGNEALLGFVSSNAHKLADNPLITGVATGGVSVAEQGTLGLLMAGAIHYYPRTAQSIRNNLSSSTKEENSNTSPSSKKKRFFNSMLLGASADLAFENAKQPHTDKENVKRVLGSAAIVGAANTVLFSAISGTLVAAEKAGFESEADTFVDVFSNPLTYVGLYGAILGGSALYNKKKARNASHDEPITEDSSVDTKE
jgi:hypothetical protein